MRKKAIAKKFFDVIFGLFIYSIGDYLTMFANLGYTPWDSLSKVLADIFNVNYGLTNALIAFIILIIDLILKEKVGFGTIIDSFLVGYLIDFWKFILPVKTDINIVISGILLVIGFLVMAIGQLFYMSGGLSCGPRDTMFVGIGKRFPNVKIGLVDVAIKIVLVIIVVLLKGPVGVGTFVGLFGLGIAMQIVFDAAKFEPRNVKQESVIETIKNIRSSDNENS